MLPQGVFSVAIATVLFPTLARYAARADFDRLRSTMANGMRQILLLLVPARRRSLSSSEPMTRLVYQRGDFGASRPTWSPTPSSGSPSRCRSTALFLLLTRTFFSLQRPWLPTAIAAGNLASPPSPSFLLYEPFGIGGIVAATEIATIASVARSGGAVLRNALGRLELGRLVWRPPGSCLHRPRSRRSPTGSGTSSTEALGRGLGGQIVSLGVGLLAGATSTGRDHAAASPRGRPVWPWSAGA